MLCVLLQPSGFVCAAIVPNSVLFISRHGLLGSIKTEKTGKSAIDDVEDNEEEDTEEEETEEDPKPKQKDDEDDEEEEDEEEEEEEEEDEEDEEEEEEDDEEPAPKSKQKDEEEEEEEEDDEVAAPVMTPSEPVPPSEPLPPSEATAPSVSPPTTLSAPVQAPTQPVAAPVQEDEVVSAPVMPPVAAPVASPPTVEEPTFGSPVEPPTVETTEPNGLVEPFPVNEFTGAVRTRTLELEIGGFTDMSEVEAIMFSVVEDELSSYLDLMPAIPLEGFELTLEFADDRRRRRTKRRDLRFQRKLETLITTVRVSVVYRLREAFPALDETTGTELLEDFFMGDSLQGLLTALDEEGLQLEFLFLKENPDDPNAVAVRNHDDNGREPLHRNPGYMGALFGGLFCALVVLSVVAYRQIAATRGNDRQQKKVDGDQVDGVFVGLVDKPKDENSVASRKSRVSFPDLLDSQPFDVRGYEPDGTSHYQFDDNSTKDSSQHSSSLFGESKEREGLKGDSDGDESVLYPIAL